MDSLPLTRIFLMIGLAFLFLAGTSYLATNLGLSIGKLPGDLHLFGAHGSFSFPIVTCLLLSLSASFLINLALRFFGNQ